MAFLHCHNKKCGWSQDDFWSWGYNPLRSFIGAFFDYIWPRIVIFDSVYAKEMNWKGNRRFSWLCIADEFKSMIRKLKNQQYCTWEGFEKHKLTYRCPKCGAADKWDID